MIDDDVLIMRSMILNILPNYKSYDLLACHPNSGLAPYLFLQISIDVTPILVNQHFLSFHN